MDSVSTAGESACIRYSSEIDALSSPVDPTEPVDPKCAISSPFSMRYNSSIYKNCPTSLWLSLTIMPALALAGVTDDARNYYETAKLLKPEYRAALILIIVSSVSFGLLLLLSPFICCYCKHRRRKKIEEAVARQKSRDMMYDTPYAESPTWADR